MINRNLLAVYCQGNGIEIGAYHNPFPVPPTAHVTYVDKQAYGALIEMRNKDPNLGPSRAISSVDIVDDGQWLKTIADRSQDFVISSHQLEHCPSPLDAIRNHLRVLKPGKVVIYALPDMRFTFDRDRKSVDLNCLMCDYELMDKESMIRHYDEYLLNVDKIEDKNERRKIALDRIDKDQDIHFHAWDAAATIDMFRFMKTIADFEIELFSRAAHENFIVLRKV